MWRNGPQCIIASTRIQNNRSKLYNTYISEALRPADHSTLVTVEMDNYGSIAFAVGVGDTNKVSAHTPDIDSSSTCSDNDNEKFQITQSVLYFDDKEPVILIFGNNVFTISDKANFELNFHFISLGLKKFLLRISTLKIRNLTLFFYFFCSLKGSWNLYLKSFS